MLSVIRQALYEASGAVAQVSLGKADLRINKINEFLDKHEHITNRDARELLAVSPATATRILSDLSKSGKLRRIRVGSHWGYVKV